MMALVNFVGTTVAAQAVLFAEAPARRHRLSGRLLFSAGSAGVIVLSLLARARYANAVPSARWPSAH